MCVMGVNGDQFIMSRQAMGVLIGCIISIALHFIHYIQHSRCYWTVWRKYKSIIISEVSFTVEYLKEILA